MSDEILIPHDALARQEMLARASRDSKAEGDSPQAEGQRSTPVKIATTTNDDTETPRSAP